MATDLDNNRTLYNLDPVRFNELVTQQAQGRALSHAALIRADGSFVMRSNTTSAVELPDPPIEAVQTAADGRPVPVSYTHLDVYKRQVLSVERGAAAVACAEGALGGHPGSGASLL